MTKLNIPIMIKEDHGEQKIHEPVRLGVPLTRGLIFNVNELVLLDCNGRRIAFQGKPLSSWIDNSIRWLIIDFFVDMTHGEKISLILTGPSIDNHADAESPKGIKIIENEQDIHVDTGKAVFGISKSYFTLFKSIQLGNENLIYKNGFQVRMVDHKNILHEPIVDHVELIEDGNLRASILIKCRVNSLPKRKTARLEFYFTFFFEMTLVRIDAVIRNPHAAVHPGGMWDLGDRGSIFFQDLSLEIHPSKRIGQLEWSTGEGELRTDVGSIYWKIYQDSSGGENWNSRNHIGRKGDLTVSFKGFRVYKGSCRSEEQLIEEGARAVPHIKLKNESFWLSIAVDKFWQNFPKALRWEDGKLSIGLFPRECRSEFELQGGEQKRHTMYLEFGACGDETIISKVQKPATVYIDPEYIEQSRAIPFFCARKNDPFSNYSDYVAHAVEGNLSFVKKRETIDEYGWRHFGDIYGDHEAVNQQTKEYIISHYNNQYDLIHGALLHYLGSGDRRWFDLAVDGANHLMDIDIYHTIEDKAAYNNGMFWHTEHYTDAQTCTHRTYSRKNIVHGCNGGGPSNEHIYTSGLLYYYYLTGDLNAVKALTDVAEWVLMMDDGSRTLLGLIDQGPTGKASQTGSEFFHGPGRGAGNAINALLDAYECTNNRKYMIKAEELIQRCIHPEDSIPELRLDEPEKRWSYLAFLQVLGKFLEKKTTLCEKDYIFYYARDSLLQYANWMIANEVPYYEVLNKVEYPTETWPAQDIRKNHILHLAGWFSCKDAKGQYHKKAAFFFDQCLSDLLKFETAYCTRPMVILIVYGLYHAYFTRYQSEHPPYEPHGYDFWLPQDFIPQKIRFKSSLKKKIKITFQLVRQMLVSKYHEVKLRISISSRYH